MSLIQPFLQQFGDFVLILARTGGFVAFAPVLGARNVPNLIKVFMSFTLALIFTNLLAPMNVRLEPLMAGAILQLAVEVSIGVAIGFAATIFFEVIVFAGYIIDYMIGFGFINIVDPQSGASVSLFSFFYNYLTLLVFLLFDAHHALIEVFLRGYELIPVAGASVTLYTLDQLASMGSSIFSIGFRISAPIFILMFLVDFSFGMLGKLAPQLQILSVGLPVKIGVGLIAMSLILKPTVIFIAQLLHQYRDSILWMLKYWGGGGP